VINLWEIDADIVFQRSLTTLLPFVPILRGGGDPPVVRRALQQLREDEELNELEPLLAFFATFVLDSATVRQLMRWDMAILRESPWYNEILKEGTDLGIRQEILEGIELGLELKFGAEGLELLPEIRQIQELETLKQIRSSLRTVASIEPIRQIYTE
jgi:predicted transposase YdaD